MLYHGVHLLTVLTAVESGMKELMMGQPGGMTMIREYLVLMDRIERFQLQIQYGLHVRSLSISLILIYRIERNLP